MPSYPIPWSHVLLAEETYLWEVTLTIVTLVTPPTPGSSEEHGQTGHFACKAQGTWPGGAEGP